MAKQLGPIRLSGKVGGLVLYNTRTAGALAREQAQGMSERNRRSRAYANSRLCSSEWGYCASLMSQLARVVNKHAKGVLIPFAGQKAIGACLEWIGDNTSKPWGQRTLLNWGKYGATELLFGTIANRLVDYWEYSGFTGNVYPSGDYYPLNRYCRLTMNDANFLRSLGATHIRSEIYTYRISEPQYNPITRKFGRARVISSNLLFTEDVPCEFGSDLVNYGPFNVGSQDSALSPASSDEVVAGAFTILRPYYIEDEEEVVLNDHLYIILMTTRRV